jgi:hypothetical protein
VTAYQGLVGMAGLEKGQRVFINGGSSSVGAFAIQIAKAKGCWVYASASGKNEEFVRGLGADEVGLHLYPNIPNPNSLLVHRLHKNVSPHALYHALPNPEIRRHLRRHRAHRPITLPPFHCISGPQRNIPFHRPNAERYLARGERHFEDRLGCVVKAGVVGWDT